jgi:hypothetical protein
MNCIVSMRSAQRRAAWPAEQKPSNSLEPAGDRPSDLVGTALLHEVEASDHDGLLVSEAARLS